MNNETKPMSEFEGLDAPTFIVCHECQTSQLDTDQSSCINCAHAFEGRENSMGLISDNETSTFSIPPENIVASPRNVYAAEQQRTIVYTYILKWEAILLGVLFGFIIGSIF